MDVPTSMPNYFFKNKSLLKDLKRFISPGLTGLINLLLLYQISLNAIVWQD